MQEGVEAELKTLAGVEAELKILAKDEEEEEERHLSQIKLLELKIMSHMVEHENTVNEVKAASLASIKACQKAHDERKDELYETMGAIVVDTQNLDINDHFRELEQKHEKEMATIRDNIVVHERLIKARNMEDMALEQNKLENLEKTGDTEMQMQWDIFIKEIMEDHSSIITINQRVDDCMELATLTAANLEQENSDLKLRLRKVKEEMRSLPQKNRELAERVSELKEKNARGQMKLTHSKKKIKMPQRKAVENLKAEVEMMEQKLSKLKLERDELSKFLQSVQDEDDLMNRPLDVQLQTQENPAGGGPVRQQLSAL